MDDLGNDPHTCTTHAASATLQATGAIPTQVAIRLLAEFQDIGNLLCAYAALAQREERHECAWRLHKQAQEMALAAALIRPSLAR